MNLHEIKLSAQFGFTKQKDFNTETWAVSELYWSFLKEYDTSKVKKCVISASDDWGEEQQKYTNWEDLKEVSISFDFAKYFTLDKQDKKHMQLEAIHDGMLQIAKKEKWEKQPLIDAYNQCLEKDLEYQFFVGTPKLSPDRKLKINFWCNWDIDIFEVYSVLYDKNNNELERKKIIEKPPYNGEFIYYAKWKWLDSSKVLLEDKYKYGNNEKWEIEIKN
ncbi:hypothetical protein C1637_21945 [Chryseobacterium lactis]|uniref:DUF1642 domain-containing protein n=1 Tax=Chryseobacterium lactis TaxID=1241981 RepID=A0A3G6RN54_CHRLC|nr:hypothetical protein [Chryseobacterium lactis]AZA84945.1 hypothetical protein EG342_24905 [Chryseobacterium lactis]AZB05333.1 hypothetical protein EG341_15785 [Chryseobacterium lactis]PNW11482.1 hypothetical protein C1637_21945 [Chryseobacterium lactis]